MDIFGIGAAELVVIALVILVVAGPQRSLVWAKKAGFYLRQLQMEWQKLQRDIKADLGPEGQELVKTASEITKTAAELRRAASPPNLFGQTLDLANKVGPTKLLDKPAASASKTNGGATEPASPSSAAPANDDGAEDRYSAWKPKPADGNPPGGPDAGLLN